MGGRERERERGISSNACNAICLTHEVGISGREEYNRGWRLHHLVNEIYQDLIQRRPRQNQ